MRGKGEGRDEGRKEIQTSPFLFSIALRVDSPSRIRSKSDSSGDTSSAVSTSPLLSPELAVTTTPDTVGRKDHTNSTASSQQAGAVVAVLPVRLVVVPGGLSSYSESALSRPTHQDSKPMMSPKPGGKCMKLVAAWRVKPGLRGTLICVPTMRCSFSTTLMSYCWPK